MTAISSSYTLVVRNSKEEHSKSSSLITKLANKKIHIITPCFLEGFFKNRDTVYLLAPWLSFRDLFSLRQAVAIQDREYPLYQLLPFDRNNPNDGFIKNYRICMKWEINLTIRAIKTEHQQCVQTQIFKIIDESKDSGNPEFKEKIRTLLFEYLFTLTNAEIERLQLESIPLGHFPLTQNLFDFLKIKEAVTCPNEALKNELLSELTLKKSNELLLLIASQLLYLEKDFDSHFKLIKVINLPFVENALAKDRMALISLGEVEKASLFPPSEESIGEEAIFRQITRGLTENLPLTEEVLEQKLLILIARNEVPAIRELLSQHPISDVKKSELCHLLIQTKRFDLSLTCAQTIQDAFLKKGLCLEFAHQKASSQAFKLFETIQSWEPNEKQLYLDFINEKPCRKILKLINELDIHSLLKKKMALIFIHRKAMNEALTLTKTMDDSDKVKVCTAFLDVKEINKAFKLAQTIKDSDYQGICFCKVYKSALSAALEFIQNYIAG